MLFNKILSLLTLCSVLFISQSCTGVTVDPWKHAEEIVASIQEPSFPERSFDVRDLGAKGDGTNNDLPAIMSAITMCNTAGGGTVIVPKGTYFLQGPIHFKSNVELHLEEGATLKFSAIPQDFLPLVYTRWEGTELFNYSPFIYANNCEDIAITGSGIIDGNAGDTFAKWRKKQKFDQNNLRTMGDKATPLEERNFGDGHFLRPSMIQFINCKRILMDGVKVIESPFWIIHPVYSSDIIIRNIHVKSYRLNNDGIDVDSSSNVLIEDCTFQTGDDAVVIKSGRDREGRVLAKPSENIVIRNNNCLEVHNGIAIGSEMSGSVRNVFIENCKIKSGRNLIYFKSNLDRGGMIENVHVRNIDVEKASVALIRFQTDYHSFRGGHHPPIFRNFHIDNITCKETKTAIEVKGHVESPIKGVFIRNVKVEKAKKALDINAHDQVDLQDVSINGKNY